jgi:hypothetical protein
MEKGCGSTIWRTYESEVRGKPERLRRDDPTNPWVELSRKTCSNGPPLSFDVVSESKRNNSAETVCEIL